MGLNPKKPRQDEDDLFPEAPAGSGGSKSKTARTSKRDKPEKSDKPEKADKPAKAEKAREPEPAPEKARKPAPEAPEKSEPRGDLPDKSLPKPKVDASTGGGLGKKIVLGAAVLLALSGVSVLAYTQLGGGDGHPQPFAPRKLTPVTQSTPIVAIKSSIVPVAPRPSHTSTLAPLPHRVVQPPARLATKPKKKGHSLKELAERSTNHAAIARTLEAYDAVRNTALTESNGRLFEDFKAKQKREAELIEQIRLLGPAAVAAMADMITDLDDQGYRLLLAKAMAGMNNPEALKATADLLATCGDLAIQTTLVRSLPDGADGNSTIATAFAAEQNANARAMLLREYAHRVGDPDVNNPNGNGGTLDDAAKALFRQAALSDTDPSVRAEAVQIIGRRGDPGDADLLAQIAQQEPNLQIRQSAIVAYALTAQDQSIPTLASLAESQDNQLEVRASAVLALARVGGSSVTGRDSALQALDQIAQTDSSDQIRSRAEHFAQSIRNSANQPRTPINNAPIPFAPRGR